MTKSEFVSRCRKIRLQEKSKQLALEEKTRQEKLHSKPKRILSRSHVTVENFVFKVKLSEKLSLSEIASAVPGVRYCPKVFSACVIKFSNPSHHTSVIAASLFKSGKVVITGPKSQPEAEVVAKKLIEILNKYLTPYSPRFMLSRLKLRNVVMTARLGTRIALKSLHNENGSRCTYSPKKFTGLSFNLEGYNQTAIVFESGFINLTGSSTVDRGYEFFDEMMEIIEPHCENPLPLEDRK